LPGIEGAPRGAHCTATAAATAAVAKVALACIAALCFHNPAPRIRHKYLPGWLVSSPQRKRFCTLLLPRPRARKAAGCAMPSTPQTCKESAPCVPRRSGIGIARCRCDEHHRQPGASESPKGARSRATAPEHGTAISTKARFHSAVEFYSWRGEEVSGGNGGVAAFCCAVAGRLCCEQGAEQQRTLGARAWRLLRAVLRSARHAYCASFQVTAVEFLRRQKASSANAFVCRDSSERAFKFRARAAQRTLRQRSADTRGCSRL
jgi:hypothetical protein